MCVDSQPGPAAPWLDAARCRVVRRTFATIFGSACLALAACSAGSDAAPDEAATQPQSNPTSRQSAPPVDVQSSSDNRLAPARHDSGASDTAAQTSATTNQDSEPADDATPEARLDGFGPLRLGMTTREAVRAWPDLYADRPQRIDARSCDYAQVPGATLPYVALKFDEGRFVRYGGSSDALAAPGGGHRGMSAQALQAMYADALRREPDPEHPRGPSYRLVHDTHGVAPTRLAFVIDGEGRIIEWYVGLSQGEDHSVACPS